MAWLRKQYYYLRVLFLAVFRTTELFDKINQLNWYQNLLRQWVNDQHFTVRSKLIEIGCATGALTAYLSTRGYIPTGVDYSSKMISLAKIKNHHINFIEADIHDLPFNSNSFDGVISASLLNLIDDKTHAMTELSRICKKGGRIAILVPLSEFEDSALPELQHAIGNSNFSFAVLKIWHKLAPKMTTSDITTLFTQSGLINISITTYLQGMVISISGIKS